MWFLNSRQTFTSFTPKVELPTTTQDIFTVGKRSCRKVMFSQACVKNGGCLPDTPQQTRQTLPQADTPWADTPWADTPWADTPWADTPWADTPPGRYSPATAAGGTHPTGMHSCFISFLVRCIE